MNATPVSTEAEELRQFAERFDRDPVSWAFSNAMTIAERKKIAAALRAVAQAAPVQRNWTEDASHENGNYECQCCECGQMFIGHKRRVLCKACSDLLTPAPQTLPGMIAAVYGSLDAKDCKWIDGEWAKQRGYILPADGTSTLAQGQPGCGEPVARNASPQEVQEACAQVADRTALRCVREQIPGDATATFIAKAIRALIAPQPLDPAEDMEALREIEIAWLSDRLSESIAGLGYPVGMGIAPHPDSIKKAATILFDRYAKMIEMALRASVGTPI